MPNEGELWCVASQQNQVGSVGSGCCHGNGKFQIRQGAIDESIGAELPGDGCAALLDRANEIH